MIKIRSGLLLLNLAVVVLVAIILLFPSNILRITLGLPFVLFFPGYALMVVLFPRKARMVGVERIALSFGLSIAIVSLIGLILNYMPWGIRLESILYSIASFILIMSIMAWVGQRRIPEEERYNIDFHLRIPSWGTSALDKTLSITLALAVIGALGMLGYVIAAPKVGEKLTEFYTLEQESVTLGILESPLADVVVGRAEVRDIFIVGRTGADDVFFEEKWGRLAVALITGVIRGERSWALNQDASVRVWRGEQLVGKSVVSSLNSLKADAESSTTGIVSTGYLVQAVAVARATGMISLAGSGGDEIGIGIEGFNEYQIGDTLEFFIPSDVKVGREQRIIVGIANYNYETVSYRLEVRINGVKNNEVQGITLEHGERWENEVGFIPKAAGSNQKVEFLLYKRYKNGGATPCFEPLRLWVDVWE